MYGCRAICQVQVQQVAGSGPETRRLQCNWFSLGGRMTILPKIKYRCIPAAMPGVIAFALFGIVTISCSVPSVAAATANIELTERISADRCSAATQAQNTASTDCCCTQPALVKGDRPQPAKVAILTRLTADPALLHPVLVILANSDQARRSSGEFSLPVYLTTQRLRI